LVLLQHVAAHQPASPEMGYTIVASGYGHQAHRGNTAISTVEGVVWHAYRRGQPSIQVIEPQAGLLNVTAATEGMLDEAYRGVVQDKDIIACQDGMLTYRWRESRSGQIMHPRVRHQRRVRRCA
jgi:hypothetical protein